MARSGDVITNPNGETLRFLRTAADTNGELLEMEASYAPHSAPPPEHYHPQQEETFQVLAGEFRASINGTEYTYRAGDSFIVPTGVHHWMHNISDEEGRLNWQVRPALDTESFFETIWGLARDGKTNDSGTPNLLQVAVIGREFNREFRLSSPPYVVQRTVFALLAPIARLRGYRARYVTG